MELLDSLAIDIARCQECPLYRGDGVSLHLTVPGVGQAPTDIMFVAEAPGEHEAELGLPFVGQAGTRLTALLSLTSLTRDSIFLTNLLKHRPPHNKFKKSYAKACAHWLDAQLALVQPRIIVALGRHAVAHFDKKARLTNDHGMARRITYHDQPYWLVPMYHPAAALYDAKLWAVMVADFKRLDATIAELGHEPEPPHYGLASDAAAAQLALTSTTLGFDVETTSPKVGKDHPVHLMRIVGYSVAYAPNYAVYVDGQPDLMRAVLSTPLYEKICHNAKFEYGRLAVEGVRLVNFQDTKLAAWLLQKHSTHLKALTRQILGRDPITYEQVSQGRDMSEILPEEIVEYGSADADNALQLWAVLSRELREAGLWNIYERIELPLIPVLYGMEAAGIKLDVVRATALLADLEEAEQAAKLDTLVHGLPVDVSVDSADQLAAALEALGAPITKRTDVKQQLSTDEDSLTAVREWNPALIDSILYFRTMRKLRGYVDQWLRLVAADGRIHPDFVQAGHGEETSDTSTSGPVTGRLSCHTPNLQNVPHHKKGLEVWAKRMRQCFVAEEGWVFVAADVSQEEPRIAAYITQDAVLQADFNAGVPIYAPIGQLIYGRPITKRDNPTEWHVAKTCFLSLTYGADWRKLVEIDSSITPERAKAAYRALKARYKGLASHYPRTRDELRQSGMVRDWFGRRRLVPKVYHHERRVKEQGYREGANFKVQGPAASVLKLAMIWVERHLRLRGLRARMTLTVHDELVVECPVEERAAVVALLSRMTDGIMPIALPVEISIGHTWGDMEAQ